MDGLKELWVQVQPLLSSYPVLLAIGAVLVIGILKKIVHLVVTAVILVAIWFLIRELGITPDMVQNIPQQLPAALPNITAVPGILG